MRGHHIAQKISVIQKCLLAGTLFLIAFVLVGCKDRSTEIIGLWEWDTYTVHFDADDSWGAADKRNPGFEKMGGTWSMSGDTVSMSYSNGTTPDSSFILSEDGKSLDADMAAVGTMTRQRATPVNAVASVR
jgi:hypothetical protein